jgi:hypothetical protein
MVTEMSTAQHHLNSLHIYCRMRALGFDKMSAMRFAEIWERLVHPILYRA